MRKYRTTASSTERWIARLAKLVAALALLGGCTGYLETTPSAASRGAPAPATDSATNVGGSNGGVQCQPGLSACSGVCISLTSSSEHCGACGTVCTAPAVCANGSCNTACAEGFQKCGDNCTSFLSDAAHCGGCDKACEAGVPCVGGVCGCPESTLFCQGQCFDAKSSDQHCGNCETACLGGAACVDGACQCPPGDTLCGNECSSLNGPKHCGSCEKSCASGETCAIDSCIPATQPCPGGLTRCGDSCVNLGTTRDHCASCEVACAATQSCSDGKCECPAGKTLCGGSCVDLNANSLHCGACPTTCTAGQSCQAGQCKCANESDIVCEQACTDPKTDLNHCGDCQTKCLDGLPCTDGKCECPTGEELCGGRCLSTDSTAEHCGACGSACPAGESCLAGKCSGAIGDACNSTLALGISIRDIAVYQAGKVPIVKDGQAVPKEMRPADVIQGRSARVRVFVDLESGWVNRVVSARLLLANGELTPSYFSKRNVSQASAENSFATTFNFDVKGEDLTADTRYAIEIVECDGAPAGSAGVARFPASDNQELLARKTGPLKVRFVPIKVNGRTASGDTARLDGYRQYLQNMYPATHVEYTVGGVLDAAQNISADGSGWGDALDRLSALHESDDASNDVYYYGLLQPTESMGQFCGGGCVAGLGFVTGTQSFARHQRASIGLSYGGVGSAETLAHEVGHNHGRPHSPCGGAGEPDSKYPHAGGKIGWWGFEAKETLHNPSTATDIMGYCGDQWISDFTFRLFTERVALLNGAQRELPPPGDMQRFLFLLTDFSGPRWGVERPAPRYPTGEPEIATVLDASGVAITSITVHRTLTDHLGGAQLLVPYPEPGWHAVELAGAVPLSFGAHSSSQP